MIHLIKDLILSPFGAFASVFALFALAFWAVHWITKKVTQIESCNKSIVEASDKMSKKIEGYYDRQEKHMDEIRRDMSIVKAMMDIYKMNLPQLAKSQSPVNLTEKGLELSKELKADEVISRNWDKIMSDIDANVGEKNAYDIQQYCIETSTVEPEKFLDDKAISALKSKAFAEGRPTAYYAPIFGIKIRDEYFRRRGIPIEDVDRNTPQI